MSYDREKCERLMKVCQKGYPASNIHVEYANNTLAECYGVIGALMLEIDRLKKMRALDNSLNLERELIEERDKLKSERDELIRAMEVLLLHVKPAKLNAVALNHAYRVLSKFKAVQQKVETVYVNYPPDDCSICSRTGGLHMWGINHCRHCDQPWPEEYRSKP